jgi:hypothetical protein
MSPSLPPETDQTAENYGHDPVGNAGTRNEIVEYQERIRSKIRK